MRRVALATTLALLVPLSSCASQKRVATLEERIRVLEAERAKNQELAARVAELTLQLRAAGSMAEQM